jgi:uncharacterized protein YPO0396
VAQFEDRVSEWKGAHTEALQFIAKAEKMRAEYDTMMASLRAEDERIMAKKKAFEKSGAKADAQGRFDRMQGISAEVDEQDEAIAAQEYKLSRLRNTHSVKKAMLEKEKKALDELLHDIDVVAGQRKEFDAFMQGKITAAGGCNEMEEDQLSTGLSSVNV